MIKNLVLIAALAVVPVTAFAQSNSGAAAGAATGAGAGAVEAQLSGDLPVQPLARSAAPRLARS